MNKRILLITAFLAAAWAAQASAQTSSLGARKRRADVGKVRALGTREAPVVERNAVYERYSWITVEQAAPKTFEVGDLITIIVRERRDFEVEADLETKKRLSVKSEIDAFIKLTGGGLGATPFKRGTPNIDYKLTNRLKSEGDTAREDSMTMRLTGTIIDVKPNGLLVLEARARIQHDEEISAITFTGTCRKEDVTADNTILSTQVADKSILVDNKGAMRAASSRGWLVKLVDLLTPF